MSVQQMEAWKNFAMSAIPSVVLLVTVILIMRKQRNAVTIVLVAAAAAALLLPVISQFIVNGLLDLAAQMNAMPTAQQQDALTKYKPYVDKCNYYRSLLGQGTYIATLVFAIALFLWVKPALASLSGGAAIPDSPKNTEEKTSDPS
jgi:hypothetical protein